MFKDTEGHETQYCESCLDLQKKLEAKDQLSVKQSHELIRLRKERQENKQKNVNLLQKNEELEKQLENEKQALDEIEINISEYQSLTLGKPRTMRENDCIYNILNIINKAKEYKTMNTNEPNQKEMQFIYGERKGCTAIYAIDKPSPNNNSYHEFIINYEPDSETSELLGRIKLQNGNFKEFGHNGIFTEHLLIIAKDCLERFNTSKYACRENSIAINSINNALMWLNKRATERVKRGVYGTEAV